jgi:hypothetical protein
MLNDLNKLLVMKQINHPNLKNRMDLLNQNNHLKHYLGISTQSSPDVLTDAHFDSEVIYLIHNSLTLILVLYASQDLLDEIKDFRTKIRLYRVD